MMKEFIDKLISRLEEIKSDNFASAVLNEPYSMGICHTIEKSIKIVNQLAEEYKPKSNADKIRNMSDEELAEFLPVVFDSMCNPTDRCREVVVNHGECTKTTEGALRWLQSEAE